MTHWRRSDPDRFPELNPWRAREPWVTGEEREARGQLAQLKTDRNRVLADLKERELELDSTVLMASQKAEQGPRRLLTAQGEELGAAVIAAFTELGFEVQDVDVERDRAGLARVEDLNLTCPDQPEVRILAEVKGYAGGAKASDLIQIGNHAVRYTQRQGVPPDLSWYVVNQFLDRDPELRQAPLARRRRGRHRVRAGGRAHHRHPRALPAHRSGLRRAGRRERGTCFAVGAARSLHRDVPPGRAHDVRRPD